MNDHKSEHSPSEMPQFTTSDDKERREGDREQLAKLREMGRLEYRKRCVEVGNNIILLATQLRGETIEKYRKQHPSDKGHELQLTEETYEDLAEAHLDTLDWMDALEVSIEIDPTYPIRLYQLIPGQRATNMHRIAWPVWSPVKRKLSREDMEFMDVVYLKAKLADAVNKFVSGRAILEQYGISLEHPQVFND